MKSQTMILLIVAGGCGLVATMGVQRMLKKGGDESEKVQVLQASTDINVGERLSELNTHFVSIDVDACPEAVVTDLEQINERSPRIPVTAGDWITMKKLGKPGEVGAVASIPKGMQVCTIPVDATTSHSGMLQAGNRVDIMLNYTGGDEQDRRQHKVRRILQYVEVFAVDNVIYGVNTDVKNSSAKNISLLVTPEQALVLELGKKRGSLSTVLRRTDDDIEVASSKMTEDDLEGRLPDVDARSALDARSDVPVFSMPDPDSPGSLFSQLQREFRGSGPAAEPVPAEANTWTIAIWEGSDVRLELVNLDSDLPVPTRKENPVPTMPAAPSFQLPQADPIFGGEQPGGFEALEVMEGLKEAASDLWKLFD